MNISVTTTMTINRIVTQLVALAAVITGWIDPSGALTPVVQGAITAAAALVIAGVHIAQAIDNHGRNTAAATAATAQASESS